MNVRPFTSLRARLTAWYLAVLAGALILFAGLLYWSLSHRLVTHHDEELAAEASRMTALLADAPSVNEMAVALDRARGGDALILILDEAGGIRYRSAALRAGEPALAEHEVLVHAATIGLACRQHRVVHGSGEDAEAPVNSRARAATGPTCHA